MQQENAFQLLSFELELPREETRGQDRNRRNCCHEQVVIGCVCRAVSLVPLRDEVESHCSNKQSDRKMNQHHMLRMLRQKYGLRIKRIHHVRSHFPDCQITLARLGTSSE